MLNNVQNVQVSDTTEVEQNYFSRLHKKYFTTHFAFSNHSSKQIIQTT